MVQEPLSASDPYAMSGQERSKYESLFPIYDSDRDGFVTGAEAVELFSKSRLPREVSLPGVRCWHLVEIDALRGPATLNFKSFNLER